VVRGREHGSACGRCSGRRSRSAREHRSLPSSTEPATLRIEQPQKAAPTGTIGFMHPTGPQTGSSPTTR
jgi:hypothetical protein